MIITLKDSKIDTTYEVMSNGGRERERTPNQKYLDQKHWNKNEFLGHDCS